MHWIRVALLIAVALFCIPRTVQAKTGSVYFYTRTEEGEDRLSAQTLLFSDDCSAQNRAAMLFYALFYQTDGTISYAPEGTQIRALSVENGTLTLDLSEEARLCAGNERTRLFVSQIAHTAYSTEEIQRIMVLIEGEADGFPEGIDFSAISRSSLQESYERNP